jgi:hypothetical protein
MFMLSDAQIRELQTCVSTGDRAEVLACLMMLLPHKREGEFLAALVEVARRDTRRAKALYRLTVTLYDKHFPDEHTSALSALCGLFKCSETVSHASTELDELHPLIIRAAKAIGKIKETEMDTTDVTKVVLSICKLDE